MKPEWYITICIDYKEKEVKDMILLKLYDEFADAEDPNIVSKDTFKVSSVVNIGNNGEKIGFINIMKDDEKKEYQLVINFVELEFSIPIQAIKVEDSYDGAKFSNENLYHASIISTLNETRNKLLSSIKDAIKLITIGNQVVEILYSDGNFTTEIVHSI